MATERISGRLDALASDRSHAQRRLVTFPLPRPQLGVPGSLAGVAVALITLLLLVVVWISLRTSLTTPGYTIDHYLSLYTDGAAYRAFLNTVGFSGVTLAVAFMFGLPAAWLVERTDLRGKTGIYTVMTVGLLVPPFSVALGWIFLLSARIGIINQAARNIWGIFPLFDIATIPGMGWVQGLSLASLVFIMTAASFRAMDPSLEEGAQMSGAGLLRILFRVTLPLMVPSILATALLVVGIGISAFDIPLFIGVANRIFTFSTYLFFQVQSQTGVTDYGLPAAFSTFMACLGLSLAWWYSRVLRQANKYRVITGKSYRQRLHRLGRWQVAAWTFLGGYFFVSKLVPLSLLLWTAGLPFPQLPSARAYASLSFKNFIALPWPLILRGLTNTALLMLLVPTLALVLSFAISWVVLRSRSRVRAAFDFAAFLPQVIPSTIFALAALLLTLYLVRGPIEMYGSLLPIIVVMALIQLSFGTRVLNGALIQIHTELEEAARVCGAPNGQLFRRIVVPLLKPALVNSWIWLALLSFRELTIPTVLYAPQNMTLSVVVWSLINNGSQTMASAVALIMIGLMTPLIVIYWRAAGGLRVQ